MPEGSKPQPADQGSLVSTTIGAITRHIRAQELAPGDRLPSEADLARQLSVSRTVVREAFRSLAALRLIDVSAGRRATVAEFDYVSLSPVIEHGVNTEQISIQQIYDVRRTIESRTATLAALRRSDKQADTILRHARMMRAPDSGPEDIMENDLAFHLEIAKASKNPVFALIVGAFDGVTRQTWPVSWKSQSPDHDQPKMLGLHKDIAQAIADGDPERARSLMASHFDHSVKALIAAGIS